MGRSKTERLAAALVAACGLAGAPAVFAEGMDSPHGKFTKMDLDSDGKISRDEYAAAGRIHFEQLDVDHDGYVTLTELNAARESSGKDAKGVKELTPSEKMRKFDRNGDGRITETEFIAGKRAMFDQMDVDKDGVLTEDELAVGLRQLR